MTIRVTETNISDGTRHDPQKCPIALAMAERGIADRITVHGFWAWTTTQNWFVPHEARWWLFKFDAGLEVEPSEFHLEELPRVWPA